MSKRGNWSTPELIRLRELFPRTEITRLSRLLGRSVGSIRCQALSLFDRPSVSGPWTQADDLVLRRAFGAVALPDIAVLLGRDEQLIRERIEVLRSSAAAGKGPWTRLELGLLKELYGTRSDRDLEVCLSRSIEEVQDEARRQCLAKDKASLVRSSQRMPRWRPEEIDRLVQAYPHTSNLEIARVLQRSVNSVANKASQLGLKKSSQCLERMGRDNVSIRYED